jgi:predicted nucleic-acid-binding Zn-ribbon protein
MLPNNFKCPICGFLHNKEKLDAAESALFILATKDQNNINLGTGLSVRHIACFNCGYVMFFGANNT